MRKSDPMVVRILTALAVAVVLAFVVLVVYPVVRVTCAIIADVRKERRPKPQMTHPRLGLMTCLDGLWSGMTPFRGAKLEFVVAGDQQAPDEGLLASVEERLASIDRWEKAALDFLCRSEQVSPESFTLESLDFLWEDRPDSFTLEFCMEGDLDGVWRVEFENNQPVCTGRDD